MDLQSNAHVIAWSVFTRKQTPYRNDSYKLRRNQMKRYRLLEFTGGLDLAH